MHQDQTGEVEATLLIDAAAGRLGVSRRTVYYRIREGRLRTIRTRGGSLRVLASSIEALRRERAWEPPPGAGVADPLVSSDAETLALEVETFA
ncbi:MAG: helix-turn-helix domain-containing protein [Vicinamibacterales bacterium]